MGQGRAPSAPLVTSPKMTGRAARGIAVAIIGAIVLLASNLDPKDAMADGTMTARQLAQNYYNQLAAAPVFGGSPFAPSRLGNMNWLEPITNINMFRARDAQWEQQGQTWPDDDPRWIILGRQPARALTRSHNEMQQGFYRPLNNANRAERWGRSIFTLAHELGHNNWSGGTGTYVEPNADWYAKQNFRSTARSLGFHRPQIRNMWQANNGFAGIKEPPK